MGKQLQRKRSTVVVLCTLCWFWLVGCVPIQPTGQPQNRADAAVTPLRVCYSSNSATQSVMLYAYEQGIFQEYGLAVELIYIEGGSTATAALIAGAVDVCQIAGASVINGVVAGADLALIAGLFNTYPYSLMVRPEITTGADLKGQALAISDPGGSSDVAIRAALLSLGLQPDADVTILSIGGQSARLAAMESGAVVGTVVSVPETATARAAGYQELVDMSALNIPFQHTALATTRPFLAENKETTTRFLQATLTAIARMKQDQAGVTAVLAQYLSLDPDKDAMALAEAYTNLIGRYLPALPYPTLEGIQMQLDALVAENPAAATVKAADVVDTTLLQALEASGFVAQLEQK